MIAYLTGATLLAVGLLWGSDPAWAEEAAKAAATPTWRVWWDYFWKVGNFAILAFCIVKVAKQPLVDFLTNQKAAVVENIREMEKAKAEAEAERMDLEAKTQSMAKELADYEAMLTQVAEREHQELLEDAEKESRMILDRATIWAEQTMRQARRQLAHEMLEEATQIAMQKISQVINEKDQAKFFESFATELDAKVSSRPHA